MHLSVSPAFSTRDDAHFKPEIDCPVDYWLTLVSIASSWYEVQSEKDALQSDLERKAEVLGESLARTAELYLETGDRPGLEQMVGRFSNRRALTGQSFEGTDRAITTPDLKS
jgi:hypothetical protein